MNTKDNVEAKEEKKDVTKAPRLGLIILIVFCLLVGGFVSSVLTKKTVENKEVGLCTIQRGGENLYQITPGYYILPDGNYVWVPGGLAKNQDSGQIVTQMSFSCYLPEGILPYIQHINEGTIIADKDGNGHLVFISYMYERKNLEVAVENLGPLP